MQFSISIQGKKENRCAISASHSQVQAQYVTSVVVSTALSGTGVHRFESRLLIFLEKVSTTWLGDTYPEVMLAKYSAAWISQ